ncbi:MAG: hypothetical protein LC808_32145 [Actinobacteria bacterium]|nr:hypothetical protein [Actinomycetota bacterium]
MSSLKRRADGAAEDLDAAMRQLRAAIGGIPIRQGSFRSQHDNLARDVAALLVQLETTRGRIDG